MTTLLVEALLVIEIPINRVAAGQGTPDEMFLIVSERSRPPQHFDARRYCNQIVDHYRTIVAAGRFRIPLSRRDVIFEDDRRKLLVTITNRFRVCV